MRNRLVLCCLAMVLVAVVCGCSGLRGMVGSEEKYAMRVNCAGTEAYTDTKGCVWLADQVMEAGKAWGSVDGSEVDRGDLEIKGVDAPKIYETEAYGMSAYKFTVPNGKYTVRLHFAETYDGVSLDGERVFDVSINGTAVLKEFDPFKEGGGFCKPVVKECKGIAVADGMIEIGFTENLQNPEINGIEILGE